MSTLYELTDQYRNFMAAVDSGEIPEEAISDTLEGITGDISDKIDACACIVKELDADAIAIKAEKDALSERQAVKEHQRDRMKDYIRQAMAAVGKTKLETPRNRVTIGKPAQSALITDIGALRACEAVWKPYDYSKETNVDKAKLKELLTAGSVPGAELHDGAARLTIK